MQLKEMKAEPERGVHAEKMVHKKKPGWRLRLKVHVATHTCGR